MKILVTGCSGFIGMHVAEQLLLLGNEVLGLDNMNDYYEITLKQARLDRLLAYPKFNFYQLDLADRQGVSGLFEKERPERVVHLAAQAGVRYSVEHPEVYLDSNLLGFGHIMEGCRHAEVQHLVYASSSSVYGGNQKIPFSEQDQVDSPVSLYAATKKANELMAHTYSHLFGIPTTGLRFFTVYGPWGRPDMSPFLFTRAILENRPIQVFNHGDMMRDFTYIDDIVEGVIKTLDKPPSSLDTCDTTVCRPNSKELTPYRIFNIGNNSPVQLLDYIAELEKAWGKLAIKELRPMQPGDVQKTMANTDRLESWVGFRPKTSLADGVQKFVAWYRDFYQVQH
jgi:UDP-glucuronate 4-epimerase